MSKSQLISISVEDRPGTVAQAIATLAEVGVNIVSAFGWAPQGVLQLVVDDPEKAAKALSARGINYESGHAEIVEMGNRPGALHAYLAGLAEAGVNLRSLNGISTKSGAVLVWTEGA